MTRTPKPRPARAALLALLLALGLPLAARAQDAPRLTFYGFVKAETIYDTRQVFQLREGQFHLFPLADGPGTDQSNFLQTAIQTRVGSPLPPRPPTAPTSRTTL